MKDKILNVKMPPELHEQIRQAAFDDKVSMGEWIRRLIEKTLEEG